ncbi:MAG: hypothetical protein SW019_16595 [Actinomycetota bacterium]|nr:hypothetical protein [Actinomycetota bacterium]
MSRFARLIAAPALSAGILAGVVLGPAGTANASMTIRQDGSMVATPDIHAHQTMMYPRFGYSYWPTHVGGPHTDTTVHHSR